MGIKKTVKLGGLHSRRRRGSEETHLYSYRDSNFGCPNYNDGGTQTPGGGVSGVRCRFNKHDNEPKGSIK